MRAHRKSRHLLSDPHSEVRGKRHALPAIPHAVVNALSLPQMRHGVERIGHPPDPGVIDARCRELWKYPYHHRFEPFDARQRILFRQGGAAAEHQALAVGGGPVIDDDPARVRDVAPVGDERPHALHTQRFRADLIAADGNHAPPMPRRQGAGIPVGRDQEFARPDHPPGGQHLEPACHRADVLGAALIRDQRALIPRTAKQRQQQLHGIQRRVVVVDATAMIVIRGDLAVLPGPRHDADALLQSLRLSIGLTRHALEMSRRMRAVKAAAVLPIAIHPVSGCERSQIGHGVERFPADGVGTLPAVQSAQARERGL